MYVPSSSFSYSPYTQLFTRIPCGDNLFKGQSTFVAEMLDLKTILKHADNRSLVIGDELCSGTETVSAISIVSAGIITLANRNTSFIFASHLFEVSQLEAIQNLPNVSIFHMSVHYDETRKVLIYDRLLKPGPGTSLYGLEVCRSLDIDSEFLFLTQSIRQSYLDVHLISEKKSIYSTQMVVDTCTICGKTGAEVHHIQEQMKADSNGFIGHVHKNHRSNLMTVCESCHDSIHAKHIEVNGYQSTSKGVQLVVTVKEEEKKEDQYTPMIQTYLHAGKSIAWIAKQIGISTYRVKKSMK
jgi:DNA mismatch repair protein MutS